MRTRVFFLLLIAALFGLWYLGSRSADAPASKTLRPNDPWVFRSVLDKQPRMITFALNERLWAAYSTDSCSLYKVWSGSVDFTGAVYNMQHGPQPAVVGDAWFENKHRRPWTVTVNNQSVPVSTDYKGHRYTRNGHAELMYDLVLNDGRRIRINERPEYVEKNGQPGFERIFNVENCPKDVQITLKTNVGSISDPVNVVTDGEWKERSRTPNQSRPELTAVDIDGELVLRAGRPTRFTAMFVRTPLFANAYTPETGATTEGAAVQSPGEKLMAKSDCSTCHNPEYKTVGPAYKDVAQRYKNTPANAETLAKKIIAGGSGVWGMAAMSAHPDLSLDDAKSIVAYVLGLDEGTDDGEGSGAGMNGDLSAVPAEAWLKPDVATGEQDVMPGLSVSIFPLSEAPPSLSDINFNAKPEIQATVGKINADIKDFDPFKSNFAALATGYLYMEKDDNVLLQLASDDGSRLYLDGKMLIDHDGFHGMETKEAEVALRAGYHPVRIEYFQGGGGGGISLRWARPGAPTMAPIPETHWSRRRESGELPLLGGANRTPGDNSPLDTLHPSYTLSQARPETFLPKVAGMDFLPDGRLLVSTWDPMGGVYVLDGVQSGDPKKIKVKQIARGLAEPLGLKVVDGEIYVLQKQELTKLVDTDGDDIIDEYHCFAKGWRASANFHEFAFGLAYQDDYFYATLAVAIMPGGASARPQIPDRGKVVRISRKDGSIEFVARGLRTPNGIGKGPDGQLFIADNQGDWLPSSKILHFKPGAFYNSYAVDSAAVAGMPVQQPVVWLPQDEIGNSPTQPILLDDGPYKNQLLHGDVCYGGLQRVFMEKIGGEYQGCVFRFTQGLEGGTNRIVKGPDGAYYIGCIGNPGNWGQTDKYWYGLQKMQFNGRPAFEMLAVRARPNGLAIEFTEPLRPGEGLNPAQYAVRQWRYQPTPQYGGPKLDETPLPVRAATLSADRKTVTLDIPGIKAGYVVYVRLTNWAPAESGRKIWTTEAWYTMNRLADQ